MYPFRPNRKETENKKIRFPIPLIEKIEKALRNKNATFSSFVIQACEYALENMDNEKINKNNTKDAE